MAVRFPYLTLRGSIPFVLTLAGAMTTVRAASDWPHWRGPTGNGASLDGRPPVEWGESKDLKWKVEVPGKGTQGDRRRGVVDRPERAGRPLAAPLGEPALLPRRPQGDPLLPRRAHGEAALLNFWKCYHAARERRSPTPSREGDSMTHSRLVLALLSSALPFASIALLAPAARADGVDDYVRTVRAISSTSPSSPTAAAASSPPLRMKSDRGAPHFS